MASTEYWLVSVPGEKNALQAWDSINKHTSQQQLSSNWKFHIPDLKV